jgi:hypothetical protein
MDGDIDGVVRAGRRYLEALGYPGALRIEGEESVGWHGARYSFAMRIIALASEVTGDYPMAADLYRRANPAGGVCGNGNDIRWREQIEGVIRAEEQRGGCHAAIAERLLGIDDGTDDHFGTARLARAGFDLARMYRGALVTRNRDGERAVLTAALSRSPAALAAPSLERLRVRGPEDWERRLHAVEGLADAAQSAALPVLVGLLRESPPELRVRTLRAIGSLAADPGFDPCGSHGVGEGQSLGSEWERPIRRLPNECGQSMTRAARRSPADQLLPFAGAADGPTRDATAQALGRVAATNAVPVLRALEQDPYGAGYTVAVSPNGQLVHVPVYPVREAARNALSNIARVENGYRPE